MLNCLTTVGRLQEIKEDGTMVLVHQSNKKNEEGVYESFTNEYTLSGAILNNTLQYCIKGDIVGVKGYIRENKIYVERLTFLSNKKVESDSSIKED